MTRTHLVAAAAFAGALAGGKIAAAQEIRYTVTEIPPLAGNDTVMPHAINNLGEVVGSCTGPSTSVQRPFVYRPGSGTQPLPLPPGLAYGMAKDINDAGVIVGYAQPSFSVSLPLVAWRNDAGVLTQFPSASYANGLNNAGTVVGRGCLTGTQLTCYFRAVPGGVMETVGTGNHYYETMWRLVDINDAGQILYTLGANGPGHRREANATITPLPAPAAPYTRTTTWGIDNAGRCIASWGYTVGSRSYSHGFVWSPESGAAPVGPAGYASTRPRGINFLGHVVGEAGTHDNAYFSSWIWTPERGTEELLPLVDPASGLADINYIYGINDRGAIIGTGITTAGSVRGIAFILEPVAPPCPADLDGDGFVTGDDFTLFVTWFEAGDPRADMDGDGFLTGDDFTSFVGFFEGGC